MKRLISPILVLVLWESIVRLGWTDPFFVPAPSKVFTVLGEMIISMELINHLADSLKRILIGFLIAVVISVTVGILMGRFKVVELAVDPLVELIRPVSPLAIFPLAILWFGIADASKIFLIALACSFPIILNTYAGVRAIDPGFIRAARSMGADSFEVLWRVALPGCLPHVFTGVRIAWGIALIVIIAAEMIGGSSGIGYLVLDAQQTFRVDRVFAGIIAIGVLGFATDLAFRMAQRLLLPWDRQTAE